MIVTVFYPLADAILKTEYFFDDVPHIVDRIKGWRKQVNI